MTSPAPLRILLIDDHKIFLAGLQLVLERDKRFTVVGVANDGASALALAKSVNPDVVVADVHLPGEDGIRRRLVPGRQHPSGLQQNPPESRRLAGPATADDWINRGSPLAHFHARCSRVAFRLRSRP